MSIDAFKCQFSALLKRCVIVNISPSTNESSELQVDRQELLSAIGDTLREVLDVKVQYLEESALRTPANNEIVVATPHAPDVLRMDYNKSDRFDSLKFFGVGEKPSELPNFNGLHTHQEEKSQVSDNEMSTDKANNNNNNNNKDVKNANVSSSANTSSMLMHKDVASHQNKQQILNHLVGETMEDVQKVSNKLQRMVDILMPEPRPEMNNAIRRLSTILNPSATSIKKPSLNQSTRSETIKRAKAARRSLAASHATNGEDVLYTTPTTSRPSHVVPAAPTTTKKTTVSKLAQHSVGVSSFDNKPKSPLKTAKNPKYAHVQSTIPKHVVAKKKHSG